MSGSVPGGETAEPNLTPILDMVFQLITFFMLVISFKAAELDMTLQLPVLTSAKPLPKDSNLKMLVLNVQVCTKCPVAGCDGYATLVRGTDATGKKVYHLVCDEHGHETPWAQANIPDGKTCLSVYRRLLLKEPRKHNPSIEDYLRDEASLSMMAANPPLTHDEVINGGKELADYVVIRADASCRYGAVDYIITKCQAQGFRKFALKTIHENNK